MSDLPSDNPTPENAGPKPSLEAFQDRIRDLPPDQARTIAARCAWRVMPLTLVWLNNNLDPYAAWGVESPWYVRSLEICCLLASMRKQDHFASATAAAVASASAAVTASTATAEANKQAEPDKDADTVAAIIGHYSVAHAARAIASAASNESIVAVADASLAAITALTTATTDSRTIFLSTFTDDLDRLEYQRAETLMHSPLWNDRDHKLGKTWQAILHQWRKRLSDMSLSDIAGRYDRLCKGDGLDESEAEHLIENWYAEFQEREGIDASSPQTSSSSGSSSSGMSRSGSSSSSMSKAGISSSSTSSTASGSSSSSSGSSTESTEDSLEPANADPPGLATSMCDRPSLIDTLGRKPLVDTLAKMLTHKDQATPTTIALLGDWGSGKSSVLAQLRERIENEIDGDFIPCVFAEFNAWEHEQCEDMQAGLAQQVITALTSDLGLLRRAWLVWLFAQSEYYAELFKLALALFLMSIGVLFSVFTLLLQDSSFWDGVAGTTLGAAMVAFIAYAWKHGLPVFEAPVWREMSGYMKLPDYRERMGHVPVMKRHLRALGLLREIGPDPERFEKNSKESDRSRLILYVDDLDRCSHTIIVKMLDAVRLVMDAPGIIVVLAIDPGVLMEAVTKDSAYGKRGREYLGKIIQLPIHLGNPQASDLGRFVETLMPVTIKSKDSKKSADGEQELGAPAREGESNDGQDSALEADVKKTEGEAVSVGGAPVSDEPDTQTDTKPIEMQKEGDSAEALSFPNRAEEISEEDLDREMRHDQDEQDLFAELTVQMSIDNPRRLIRLFNTYRLMKLLWFQYLEAQDRDHYDSLLVMQVLFVADKLSEHEDKQLAMNLLKLLEGKKLKKGSLVTLKHPDFETLLTQVSAALKPVKGELMDTSHRITTDLFRLARSLLLPHTQLDPGPETDGSEGQSA